MRRQISIALIVSCLAAAWIFHALRPQTVTCPPAPGSSQPGPAGRIVPDERTPLLANHPALAPLTSKSAISDETERKSMGIIGSESDGLFSSLMAEEGLEPGAKALFEVGFRLMGEASYREAREAFQSLINTFPHSKLASAAFWAIGLSYYGEGGRENLLEAADQFKNYLIFWGYVEQVEEFFSTAAIQTLAPYRRAEEDEYSFSVGGRSRGSRLLMCSGISEQESLAEAALVDIAVINLQLMRSTTRTSAFLALFCVL